MTELASTSPGDECTRCHRADWITRITLTTGEKLCYPCLEAEMPGDNEERQKEQ